MGEHGRVRRGGILLPELHIWPVLRQVLGVWQQLAAAAKISTMLSLPGLDDPWERFSALFHATDQDSAGREANG